MSQKIKKKKNLLDTRTLFHKMNRQDFSYASDSFSVKPYFNNVNAALLLCRHISCLDAWFFYIAIGRFPKNMKSTDDLTEKLKTNIHDISNCMHST